MIGIGHIAQSLNTLLTNSVNGLGFVPMKSDFGNAFDLAYIPVNQIKTDEKNFQNRADKYSEKSVQAIIKAVKNNSFNWFAFDPVLLWENPDGDLIVLSGHSRTEAFRRLASENPDLTIDGLNFSKIPAKIFKGDFVNAKNLALNSNALSTPETLLERSEFYRKQRQNLSKRQDIAKLREKALRENQGAVIWDLSFLPPDGLTVDSLRRFKLQEDSEGAFENFIRAINIAQWIGKAFQIYPGLSKMHDNELFKFLVNNYGTKSGQYNSFTKLNDRLSVLYPRNVKNDKKINAKGEYTTPFGLIIYEKTDNEIAELDNLKKESEKAKRELSTKIKDLRGRTDDKEKIFEIVTPYFNSYINNLFQYWQGLDREKRRYEDKSQTALFGLGALGAAKQLEFLFPEVAANKELIATDKGVQYSIPFSNVAKQLSFDFFNQSKSGNELITKIVDKVVELENKVEALSNERDHEAAKDARKDKIKSEIVKEDIFLKIINPLVNKVKTDKKYQTYYYLIDKIKNDILFYLTKFESVYSPDYYDALNNIATFIFKSYEKGLKKNPEKLALAQTTSALHSKLNLKTVDGLGKPKITLEFDDNTQLLNFKNNIAKNADSDLFFDNGEFKPSLKGFSVTNQPASIFNCPTSQLNFKGFKPTYKRLTSYDHLIEPATGNKTLVGYGFEKATLDELNNACRYYYQVEKLAEYLKGDNYLQSAFNLWHWLHENIKYNFDKEGEEEIRVPARTWADRESGVDCDCLAVFTACVLYCMGYEPEFEIVGFDENSDVYSHIFVNLYGAAVDRVLPVFLMRPSYIKKTLIMEIPVFELNGGADLSANATLHGIYKNTLTTVMSGDATADDSINLRKMQVLVSLQNADENAYRFGSLIMPYVSVIDDDGAFYFESPEVAEYVENADKELFNLKLQNARETELQQFFNNVVSSLKNVVVNVVKNDNQTSVTVLIRNPKNETVKTSGDWIKKELLTLNPNFVSMHEALKDLLSVNFYGLATRFAIGLMSEAEAKEIGYDSATWTEAVNALNKIVTLWTLTAGNKADLLEIIKNGSNKEPLYDVDLSAQFVDVEKNNATLSGCKRTLRGLAGLGETINVETALDRLGETLTKILEWCEKIEPYLTSAATTEKQAANNADNAEKNLLSEAAEMPINFAATQQKKDDDNNNMLFYSVLGSLLAVSAVSVFSSTKKRKRR